ncbi:MAG TPA: hypothetical protein VGB66_16550 [Longimicrobium sp.]
MLAETIECIPEPAPAAAGGTDEYRDLLLAASSAAPDATTPAPKLDPLPKFGDPSRFRATIDTSRFFKPPRAFRYTEQTVAGENRSDNHFQGVARAGDYLLVTGADWTERRAHLLIVKVKRDAQGAPTGGSLERIVAIDTQRPHPGGVQRSGNLLVVPVEGGGLDSCVRFFDVSDPASPKQVGGSTIVRKNRKKAGAAGVARLPDGRLLVAVWWDEKKKSRLGFYLSKSTNPADGFHPKGFEVDFKPVVGKDRTYQAIALLSPELVAGAAGQEVRLWFVGLHNDTSKSGFVNGSNQAELAEIRFPAPAAGGWADGTGGAFQVGKVIPQTFNLQGFANFAAAAGVDVESENRLSIYATHLWRTGEGLQFCWCRTKP